MESEWVEVKSSDGERIDVISLGAVGLLKVSTIKLGVATASCITTIGQTELTILLKDVEYYNSKNA